MARSDLTSPLAKWPFLAGDGALLAAAWLIAENAAHPLSTDAMIAIVVCGMGAAFTGAIPFLADYARKQDQALDERQQALEALTRSAAAAAEQISIAAAGYHQVAELSQANLQQAEQVQQHLQNASTEFLARLATARMEERRKLEKDFAALRSSEIDRLGSALEKVSQAVADLDRMEAWLRKDGSLLPASPGDPVSPGPGFFVTPAPGIVPAPTVPEAPAPAEIATAVEANSARAAVRKRTRNPPKPIESPSAPATGASGGGQDLFAGPPAEADSEFSQTSPDEAAPTRAVSADGATRLLVTAYIGIGNRLYIRGVGPGLSWERGVPLDFVSIGKWRWESAEASAPIEFKLYKNDEVEWADPSSRILDPGQQQEITAKF